MPLKSELDQCPTMQLLLNFGFVLFLTVLSVVGVGLFYKNVKFALNSQIRKHKHKSFAVNKLHGNI